MRFKRFIYPLFLVAFLTFLVWHRVLDQALIGEGPTYFVEPYASMLSESGLSGVAQRHDVQALIFFHFFADIFQDNMRFYMGFLLLGMISVNFSLFWLASRVTKSVWAGVMASVIFIGDGEFTKRLVSLDAELVATDITPKLVDKGKKKLGQHVVFQLEDAERLSFKDTSFDIVCGVSILHHLNEKNALKEACRVLKKGGQLFFTEPNLLNPQIFLGLHIPQLRQLMEFSPDETALIRWDVAKSLTETGFKDMVVRNYDFLHPKTPERMIDALIKASNFLEKIPLVKELSGSLVIWAKK